jgi:hypothetical protein
LTKLSPDRVLETGTSELAKSVAKSIQNNLKLKNFMSKRMIKKLAFDANRAKWLMANELSLDDPKRNQILGMFSQIKQKLIKHSVYVDFDYPDIKY